MQAIDVFESRCIDYQDSFDALESTALRVYLLSHKVVYGQVDYMMPDQPPSVELLSITVREVCRQESSYGHIFEQMVVRYVALAGDEGVSSHVIFYYVSNVVISLLVLSRKNSQLSGEILIKIIQKFNFRDAVLRAGIEVIAEEVLRRCFLSINDIAPYSGQHS